MNPHKTGMVFGGFMALWHFIWAILVVIGLAQLLLDWIFSLHFMDNSFSVQEFNWLTAVSLVIVTGVIGYIAGYVFAHIWNWMQKK